MSPFLFIFIIFDNTPCMLKFKRYVHYLLSNHRFLSYFGCRFYFSANRADPDAMPQPETKRLLWNALFLYKVYKSKLLLLYSKLEERPLFVATQLSLHSLSLSHLWDVRYKLFLTYCPQCRLLKTLANSL